MLRDVPRRGAVEHGRGRHNSLGFLEAAGHPPLGDKAFLEPSDELLGREGVESGVEQRLVRRYGPTLGTL